MVIVAKIVLTGLSALFAGVAALDRRDESRPGAVVLAVVFALTAVQI